MTFRRAVTSLAALFRRRKLDREMDSEILAHLELAEKDLREAGHSPAEARRLARLRFGAIAQLRDEHREQRSLPWIENLFRDLRHGASALARAPGFTATAVAVLALGVGANVAMFSVLDAVLLKPLPFPEPDRIVRVWEAPRPGAQNSTMPAEFLEWKRLATTFSALAAEANISAAIEEGAQPLRLNGKTVTADYFKVFGVNAAIGRTLTAADTEDTVVLSHAAWQNEFGADPAILERRIRLDRIPHRVAGVLAPGAFDRGEVRFWKPLIFTPDQLASRNHWLQVSGRLSGSLAQSCDQMQAIHKAMTVSAPQDAKQATIAVEPLASQLVGTSLKQSIYITFGAVLLVLLIACANVANLLLAKGATRRRELAVRAALGAGTGRLVAQLLTESLLLCTLGAAAGIALAQALITAARPMLEETVPFTANITLDWRALAFAAAIAITATVLAGVLPALQTNFGNLAGGLNRIARGSSGARSETRRVIVIAEVALSLILVSGAGLLLRSLLKLQSVETGIRTDNVLTLQLNLPAPAYPTASQASIFYTNLSNQLTAIPGVTHAGLSTHIPLRWITNGEGTLIPGLEKLVRNRFKRVDPGYFATFGIPLIAGRGFTARDTGGAPKVVVINRAMAARLAEAAGVSNPIGKRYRFSAPGYSKSLDELPEAEIVGIIAGEMVNAPGVPEPPVVYAPLAQLPSAQIAVIVRTQTNPASILPAIREAVRQVDPALPLAEIATMEQVRGRTLAGTSNPAKGIGAFAAIALLLVAVGLYGVLAQMVTQRRREIGIRMALGARARDVLWSVLRNGLAMIAVGLAVGMAGVVALTRLMKTLLFEVSPLDPPALAAACAVILLIGLLAGILPAARAAHVDPVNVLREEG